MPAQSAQGTASLLAYSPFVLVFLVWFFLFIRPQQKKQKALTTMLSNIKKGDKIITSGGILGTVAKVADDKISLTIANNVTIDMLKSAVVNVL